MNWRVRTYVYAVILVGAGVFLHVGFPRAVEEITAIMVFSAMGMLFESMSVSAPFGNMTVSVSFVPVFAATLVYGSSVGAWVGALSSVNIAEWRGGKPLYRNLFNFAQWGIIGASMGWVLTSLHGNLTQLTFGSLGAIIVTVLISYLVNAALPTIAVALTNGVNPIKVFAPLLGWSIPAYLATAPLAILIALLYQYVGYVGVGLFLLPLLLTRMSFQLYSDMRRNYIETIQSLAQAIDAKDHYTLGHSERVAFYSAEIARQLGWRQNRIDQLFFTALLHDIGKIGIREQVLNKAGRLTAEERYDVNRHAELGADIVSKVSFLREEAAYIRHHHEHYSGTGYPGGLRGEDIPLGARIIAVADSFDAMTSHRVYHSPRSAYEAVEEVKRCSGTQFDPQVVEAFLKVVTERTDILDSAQQAATAGFASLAGLNSR